MIFSLSAMFPVSRSAARLFREGRPGGNRTPNLRFWRPSLCQLSYWPSAISSESENLLSAGSSAEVRAKPVTSAQKILLLDDLGDDAGADRAATFANREAQPLFHRDRRNQRHRHPDVV